MDLENIGLVGHSRGGEAVAIAALFNRLPRYPDDATVSFNHKFLLDGLLNIKSSEIILDLNGDSGPGVVKPVGDDSYLYVVMPIKSS